MEKFANFIAVGGPIAVGKSTLLENLDLPKVDEMDFAEPLSAILLENTYSKKRVHSLVIELFFLQMRKQKYEEYANTLTTYSFDRTIFESYLFARQVLDDKQFGWFEKLFDAEVRELLENHGKPRLYIILTCDWERFYERFINRGREAELANFHANINFFKEHVEFYSKNMIEMMKKYGINYVVIDTNNKSITEVAAEAKKYAEEVL